MAQRRPRAKTEGNNSVDASFTFICVSEVSAADN